MGTLQYDGVLIEFEDRLLAHLQIVIVQKLRRGESFLMSWRDAADTGDGHSAVWLHPSQHLYFKFSGSRNPAINTDWLEQLQLSANSARGLLVMKEGTSADAPTDADIATVGKAQRTRSTPRAKVTT